MNHFIKVTQSSGGAKITHTSIFLRMLVLLSTLSFTTAGLKECYKDIPMIDQWVAQCKMSEIGSIRNKTELCLFGNKLR